MSEFRIVKCKSCTAALVELQGEKLSKCVQCGYDFSQKTNKKAKLESVVEQAFEQQIEQIKTSYPNSTNTSNKSNKTKTSNANSTNKALQQIKKKGSGSIIGTIIKWYVIIFIASKFIQEFF